MRIFSLTFYSPRIFSRLIKYIIGFGVSTTFFVLTACSPQNQLPEGPTPIPTLIPVTISPSNQRPTEIPFQVIESFPAGLPSALNGQTLYNEHCASCHGMDGNGLVPNSRNFGDVDYMRSETPAEFYLIITEGRGADMPAFGEELTSDERWAVVYYVWRFSTTDEILREGNIIYGRDCSSCHGEDGRSLILGAANFSDQRFMANVSPTDLYVSVTQGKDSMPAWQARLSQDERWAVIDYIRAFTYDPQIDMESESMTNIIENQDPGDERPECSSYIMKTNPYQWADTDAILAGQTVYTENCGGCHGDDGAGRIGGILDFTDPSINADINNNPGKYLCSIAEGYRSMPQYKDQFSEDQMWQLLSWIASMGK